MPQGVYLVDGRSEEFRCAPGPAGWRYASDAVDLVCDQRFEVLRFVLPGGVAGVGLRDSDGERHYRWQDTDGEEHLTRAATVVGDSPGYWIAAARAAQGQARDALALCLEDRPRVRRLRLAPEDFTTHQDLSVVTWKAVLDDGPPLWFAVTGDVILAGEGRSEIQLDKLEGPPSP